MESAKTKKEKEKGVNADIRSFFNNNVNLTTNKRVLKVIEPYLNEINDPNYKLRERKIVNYKTKFGLDDDEDSNKDGDNEDMNDDEEVKSFDRGVDNDKDDDNVNDKNKQRKKLILKKKRGRGNKNNKRKKSKGNDSSVISNSDYNSDIEYVELTGYKSFLKLKTEANKTIFEAEEDIKKLEKEFYVFEHKIEHDKSKYPDLCIPICTDIRQFNFKALAEKQKELTGQLFDVIMMDPPWQLSSSQPTRGVAIAYDTLNDNVILDIPVDKLQTDGFIFIWTINAKFKVTLDLMKQWGYTYCDEIVWVKQTVNGKIAKGHGYYLQHTKETCLIGIKGKAKYTNNVMFDVIFSKRRGQSQKPEEIYQLVEALVPKGYYLEIFGRRNNLRDKWVTIGNEI